MLVGKNALVDAPVLSSLEDTCFKKLLQRESLTVYASAAKTSLIPALGQPLPRRSPRVAF